MEEKSFHPYVASTTKIKEFSFRAIFFGIVLGFIFAVGNAYLALKIGSTISASIPAAIISMAIFRMFFKNGTILENNIVQTVATVGEGMAAGVVFTIPALILLDATPSLTRTFFLSVLGGVLGILFMIPFRRYIIVKEHGALPFPEGTACAAILKAGEKGKGSAVMAFWGVLTSAIYKICSNALYLFKETPSWEFPTLHKASFSMDATPALLGVGYIIGSRISTLLFVGGVLGWWVLIPLIQLFGGDQVIYPSDTPISQMSSDAMWSSYIRYIGAGVVAFGGITSLIKIAPVVFKSVIASFKELFKTFQIQKEQQRTDRDISMIWLLMGSLAIILALWLIPGFSMNLFTIVLLVILGFFFVGVTSVTVGLCGSTSNPVSGMTLTTLLITCLCFLALGWTEKIYLVSAITMSCVACIAICLGGTTSQDLKAGYLLGATPKSQQIAEIIGCLVPALALGGTIYLLNEAYKIGSAQMPAPQATLLTMIVKGVMSGELPYMLFFLGILLGLFIFLFRLPVLPFALGVYLPLSLTTATMVGGIVAELVQRKNRSDDAEEKGILLAAGFVGGDACIGILIAALAVAGVIPTDKPALLPQYFSLIAYGLLALMLGFFTLRRSKKEHLPY